MNRYLSLTDIAERLGMTYEGVRQRAITDPEFPEPEVAVGAKRGWSEEAVERYVAGHPAPELVHGLYRYSKRGCRCGLCRLAYNSNLQGQKAARLVRMERLRRGEVDPPHESPSTYTNYGCRCEPCKKAYGEYMRRYWERRREREKAS